MPKRCDFDTAISRFAVGVKSTGCIPDRERPFGRSGVFPTRTPTLPLRGTIVRSMARRSSSKRETIPPKISPGRAVELIRQQIARLDDEIIKLNYNDPKVKAWESTAEEILNAAFGLPDGEPDRRTYDFKHILSGVPLHMGMSPGELQRNYVGRQQKRKALLEAYMEQLQILVADPDITIEEEVAAATAAATAAAEGGERREALDPFGLVKVICARLYGVARQLRHRREGRPTLEIRDEYDVQDLLHSLLRLHFDDIRPEEWTPSYAGGSARMDFLLKAEEIVVEAKMARPGRDDRRISEELIVDAARYKEHPGCKVFVCLIYDPERSNQESARR